MEKIYLLANQIRNEEIEMGRRRAFDLPSADTTLAYGYFFEEASSGYKNNEIEVVVQGDFSARICNILNKKMKDDTNGNGLEMIEGCDGDTSEITFIFAPDFKAKKTRKVYYFTESFYLPPRSLRLYCSFFFDFDRLSRISSNSL